MPRNVTRVRRKPGLRTSPQGVRAPDSGRTDLRGLCRALQFWRLCPGKPCRRARDCKGDAQACFHTFWWQLREETRVWIRAAIRARAGGLQQTEAFRAADAEVVRWRELEWQHAADSSRPDAGEPSADASPARPVPQVRVL